MTVLDVQLCIPTVQRKDHGVWSNVSPQSDGVLKTTVRKKILHYHRLYVDLSDPTVFMPVPVNTSGYSGHLFGDFLCYLFFHAHREASALTGELSKKSDQFRFLHTVCLANLKGSAGFILAKTSVMRVTIPLDVSTYSFIPLPRFFPSSYPPSFYSFHSLISSTFWLRVTFIIISSTSSAQFTSLCKSFSHCRRNAT